MIADNAVVVGDVRLGKDVGIWFGVVIRGDDAFIEIGDSSNIQDNTVVHVDVDAPNRIGRNVTVGHSVTLHGVEIGDHTLIPVRLPRAPWSACSRHSHKCRRRASVR